MIYVALFLFFFSNSNSASEAALSFALKNISMQEALQRFDNHFLPHNVTIGQEITNHQVKLSFNRENGHILIRASNEEKLINIRDLILRHIDT